MKFAIVLLLEWAIIRLKNAHTLSKMNIVKIMRSSEREVVKGSTPIWGLLGIIFIPAGLILFNISATIYSLKSISIIFLALSLLGVYMVAARITSIGEMIRKIHEPRYMKNMLFFNLMKQKGNQCTLAFFVSAVLIATTIFAFCFNACSFFEMYYQIGEEPYDYAVFVGTEQQELNEVVIADIAEKTGIALSDFNTLNIMRKGKANTFKDKRKRHKYSERKILNLTAYCTQWGVSQYRLKLNCDTPFLLSKFDRFKPILRRRFGAVTVSGQAVF